MSKSNGTGISWSNIIYTFFTKIIIMEELREAYRRPNIKPLIMFTWDTYWIDKTSEICFEDENTTYSALWTFKLINSLVMFKLALIYTNLS